VPGVHSPDREPIGVQVPRDLVVKLKKAARLQGASVTNFVERMIREKCGNVPLDGRDRKLISEATAKARITGRRIATKLVGRC
jgi:uncharacterized protein (DUF1778 family)